MYYQLMGFLNANNILYRHQYGFGRNHSTIHPIIHLLNHCEEAASESPSEYTIASLCDLPKAFDVTNHDILLNKLHRYGIRETVNEWLKSYLRNKLQFVEMDRTISSSLPICFGVLQGPLLYLI